MIYAGLGGTLLALIVATATNGWQPRIFFLLALRLAIGWHFMFEGLHKIHSHVVGPTDAVKPFSSEPYFAAADGPLGPLVRAQFLGDTDAIIAERIRPQADKLATFSKMSDGEQAALCPTAVVQTFTSALERGITLATEAQNKANSQLEDVKAKQAAVNVTDQDAAARAKKAFADAVLAAKSAETQVSRINALQADSTPMKLAYVRWMYGATRRDAKVKYFGSDVPQSAPERLAHIALLEKRVQEITERDAAGLGNGYGYDVKKASAARSDLSAAKADLIADATALIQEEIQSAGGKAPEPAVKPIVLMDKLTMWTLTIVGACLLFGLFTPVSCLIAAGFLAMTYLTHPPFPWLPQPPNTEGNPLFVNKNVIELLSLLVIAVHPTGRWLGLDAFWTWLLFGRRQPDPEPIQA